MSIFFNNSLINRFTSQLKYFFEQKTSNYLDFIKIYFSKSYLSATFKIFVEIKRKKFKHIVNFNLKWLLIIFFIKFKYKLDSLALLSIVFSILINQLKNVNFDDWNSVLNKE